jgi:phage terminase small subunit
MNEKCPPKLGAPGVRFWKDVVDRYQLRPDELRVLEQACRTLTLLDKMQKTLDKADSLTAVGSMGQPVMHPIVSELRQHRNTLRQLTNQLGLPDEDDSRKTSRSAQARDAVNARWRRTA